MPKLNLAVFVSGGGTNLQSIIDAVGAGKLDADIRLVLSNKSDAYGLTRARNAGIPTAVISSKDFPDRDAFIERFLGILDEHNVDFIALAGYLRKIPLEIIDRYRSRIVNIHPGPLPDFGGKGMYGIRVHEAVLEAGIKETCVTIHYVTEGYDEGAVIATRAVPVLPDDTPEILQKRVLKVEHELYPEVLQRFTESHMV
ncbi:phosphoribosylglycinamide formyltransferase [bacterium]|nr:MAG: phosphoribosylglycinamide formyltransferase [bacterium]